MATMRRSRETLSPRRCGLMATLCAAQVLEVMGVTLVVVALPAIGRDLALDSAQLQLVVSLYAAVYGGLLLTAGRLADLVDRRAVLAGGLAVTLAGALVCALAGSGSALLAGRGGAGPGSRAGDAGGAVAADRELPRGRPRRIAVSAWTAGAAGGGAVGFAVGGPMVDGAGWRGGFWLLVPLAAIVLGVLRWVVPAHPRPAPAEASTCPAR